MNRIYTVEIPRALKQCNEFEQRLLLEVFRDGYSRNLKTGDLIEHVKAKSADLGISDDPVAVDVLAALEDFRSYHRCLINGHRGERNAYGALKRISIPNTALFNVALEDDGECVEIDALILTLQKIFIVETKNFSNAVSVDQQGFIRRENGAQYSGYNVGTHMAAKKDVLHRILERRIGKPLRAELIEMIMLDAHDCSRSMISSNFGYVKLCHLGDVSFYIDESSSQPRGFDLSEIQDIARFIEAESGEGVDASVDFEGVVGSLASFLSLVEAKAQEASEGEDADLAQEPATSCVPEFGGRRFLEMIKPSHICIAVASLALGFCGGLAYSR